MTMINANVPEELNSSLCSIAKQLDRSKSSIIRLALSSYLQDLQEDIEDYNDAVKISAINNPSRSIEEVIKDLGLEDELAH